MFSADCKAVPFPAGTVIRNAFLMALAILAGRITQGYALLAIPIVVIFYGVTGRYGGFLSSMLFLMFLNLVNPVLMPKSGTIFQVLKISVFALQFVFVLAGFAGAKAENLPVGSLLFYLAASTVSSVMGHFPLISFLKTLNFLVFLLFVLAGSIALARKRDETASFRYGIFSLAFLLVYGSLLTLPFPSIAYFTSVRSVLSAYSVSYTDLAFQSYTGVKLFTGIVNQSQALAPLLAIAVCFVLCDMFFYEKRFSLVHMSLLLPIPAMLYMTRSRIGFFSFAFAVLAVAFYAIPKSRLSRRKKFAARAAFAFLCSLLAAAMVLAELKGKTISMWLRKSNDVEEINATWSESITSSRQGLIEECKGDFFANPLFGKGFQVAKNHRELYENGQITLFSAPIEKGLLPLMVLGETGVVGAVFFLFFLARFFFACKANRYTVTLTIFSVFLATNMAEATFFSPGGNGGVHWMVSSLGGFAIDLLVKEEQRKESERRFREGAHLV